MRHERPIRACRTSFVLAADKSEHVLAATGVRVSIDGLNCVNPPESEKDKPHFKAALALVQEQPDLQHLPDKLIKFCQEEGIGMMCTYIGVKKSGTICATPVHGYVTASDMVLQPVRADNDCHGRAWHDNVRVKAADGVSWYGQLRLLFEFCGHKLAYVRWYDVVDAPSPDDILSTTYGCVCLKFEEGYDVIPFEALLSREYIVPNYKKKEGELDTYHVSVFKWDRLSVGFKEPEVDEFGNEKEGSAVGN